MIYLFFIWIIGSAFDYYRIFYTSDIPPFTLKNYLYSLLVIVFIIPIVEESLFRAAFPLLFKSYFEDEFMYKITNSILFGLSHIINLNTLKTYTLYNMFNASVLGWYLINTESLKDAIFLHIAWNFIIHLSTMIMNLIRDKYYPIKNYISISIIFNNLRMSKSLSDLKIYIQRNSVKNINEKMLPDDIFNSINLFEEKRRNKFGD